MRRHHFCFLVTMVITLEKQLDTWCLKANLTTKHSPETTSKLKSNFSGSVLIFIQLYCNHGLPYSSSNFQCDHSLSVISKKHHFPFAQSLSVTEVWHQLTEHSVGPSPNPLGLFFRKKLIILSCFAIIIAISSQWFTSLKWTHIKSTFTTRMND